MAKKQLPVAGEQRLFVLSWVITKWRNNTYPYGGLAVALAGNWLRSGRLFLPVKELSVDVGKKFLPYFSKRA